MKFLRLAALGLAFACLTAGRAHAKPFALEHGERPSGWKVIGGNELAWRFLNGALNSGNGDAENYGNPSYFYQAEPGDASRRGYIVEATVRSFQENGTFTLLARCQDQKNYYGLEYRDRSQRGRVRLVKLKDGDIRYEKTVGHGFGYDNVTIPDMRLEPIRFRLEVRGNQIRGLVNGEFEMVMEDDDFTSGAAGFANFFYHYEVMDFEVTDFVVPGETGTIAEAISGDGPARIEFRENFSEEEALAVKTYLDSQRLPDVKVSRQGERWVVRTGFFRTAAQAEVALNILESEGVTGGEVVRAGEPTILPRATAVGEGVTLALVVADYQDRQDAELHLKSLADAGYPDTRVVRDNSTGTYKVLVGEFFSERDAAEYSTKLNRAGFTTIGTIALARGVSPVSVQAMPDLEELKDVLLDRIRTDLGPDFADAEKVRAVLDKYEEMLESMDERQDIMQSLETRITELIEEQKRRVYERGEEEKKEIEDLLAEAQTQMENEEFEDARIKYNMVLRLDPNNVEARRQLANIRFKELERTRAEARVQREEEIHTRLGAAITLINQGNYDDARIHLNHILASAIREEELSEATRKEIDEARMRLADVDQRLRQKELDDLNRLAVEAAEKGALEQQLNYLIKMQLLAPDDGEIRKRVLAVDEALKRRHESEKRAGRKHTLILYGLVIFVSLFALFYVLTWFLYRRQEGHVEEEAEVPQITYEPAKDNFQEEEPLFLEDSVSLNLGEVLSAEAERQAIAGDEDTVLTSAGADVAVSEPPPALEPQAESPTPDEEPISEISEEDLLPVSPPADEGILSKTGSLEDLFTEEEEKTDLAPGFGELEPLEQLEAEAEKEEQKTPAPEEKETLPLQPEAVTEETAEEEPAPEPMAVEEPSAAEAPAKPAAAKPSLPEPVEGNLLFKQGFDDLEQGAQPPNWELSGGSLTVESGGQGGIGKCLRFHKTQGDDAYSHCRFPGIRNIFRLEFDLNCGEENQGNLQVVIEHDEKAEGLVRVAVGDGGRELAVQGVKADSTPGQWRHIKFIINLDKEVVNGFVDGKLVAYKVSLPEAPEEINSISIMGDASSSGSLMIDNIRIYRV